MTNNQLDLVPGEAIVYETRPHWVILIVPGLFAAVGTLAVLCSLITNGILSVGSIVTAVLFLGGLTGVIRGFITYQTTRFTVTNRRIIAKTGLGDRHYLELVLPQVESVIVNQRLIERLFNHGTVTVTGSGGTWSAFPKIAAPMTLRKHVNNQIAMAIGHR